MENTDGVWREQDWFGDPRNIAQPSEWGVGVGTEDYAAVPRGVGYVTDNECECENPNRRAFTYRKTGKLHCEQCDGLMPPSDFLEEARAALARVKAKASPSDYDPTDVNDPLRHRWMDRRVIDPFTLGWRQKAANGLQTSSIPMVALGSLPASLCYGRNPPFPSAAPPSDTEKPAEAG